MSEPRLYIALYADEDFRQAVIQQLLQRGYDVEYALAKNINHADWDDEQHLEYATGQKRTLISHNAKHFAPLHEKWWAVGRSHAGIIVTPQWETGVLVRRLLKLLDTVTADEMVNNYKHLGEFE